MRPASISTLQHPLDEILGSRALVRVVRVLATHGGSLAVSDIAQRSKLSLPSVRATLRRLLDLDVATAIGAGRSMACALRPDHPLVPALVSLFAAEREQATALLRAVRDAAGELSPVPWAVWLYGSAARGEDDALSDIDIAVVTPAEDTGRQAEALRDALSQARPAHAERVSVITMAPNDVRRAVRERTAFWESLTRDAVVLLGDAPGDILERANRLAHG